MEGEADGDALGESLADGDGLGEMLGEPDAELPLGLGLGETEALEDADPDGAGDVAVQPGEGPPGELTTVPPGPLLYAVPPPAGPEDEDLAPAPPPDPPLLPDTVCELPDEVAMTDGRAAIAQDAEATTNMPVASAAAGRSQPSRSARPGSGPNRPATAPAAWRSQCPAGPSSRQSGAR